VFDWLVTNYSKKKNIVYNCTVLGERITFNMHLQYKMRLKGYSKKLFDPFCRRTRIKFRGLLTTVGQLNFFRWAITYGVLDYTRRNHDAIEEDMLLSTQHRNPLKTPVTALTTPGPSDAPHVWECFCVSGQPLRTETEKAGGGAGSTMDHAEDHAAKVSRSVSPKRPALKRKQLSEAALKTCTTTHLQVRIKFN
jgi:hypothetical protein